jgi:Suppressor of fused protein (SUFU)
MTPPNERHVRLSAARLRAFSQLFGVEPATILSYADERFPIDVFIFPMVIDTMDFVIAVTNGMSDQRLVDADEPQRWSRRELIQYFRECTEGHARRLRDMAWLPLFDDFLLDTQHTIQWPHPAIEGTPWKNAFFLEPLIKPHRAFRFEVEGDPASFLWHVPISDEELAFKKDRGADDLLDRMSAVKLPWVFDEKNRPSLLQ